MNKKCESSQKLYCIQTKIWYYRQMAIFSVCPYQRNYYLYLMGKETKNLESTIEEIQKVSTMIHRNLERQKEFTLEELEKYNGEGGIAAYAAVNDIVYDVSMNITWAGGTHFGLYAGKDLTNQFSSCHSGKLEVLNVLPKVGIIKK